MVFIQQQRRIPVGLIASLSNAGYTRDFLPYWPPLWVPNELFHYYNQLLFARFNQGQIIQYEQLHPIIIAS
jgi:hypothetical protein